MAITEKVTLRISNGLKKLKPIVESKKSQDVNESDTVLLIIDILTEILGFDKYKDVSTEHEIHGTYCDLALTIDGKLSLLIEVKAIGIELKEHHVRQAVDYAAKKGLKWVLLSNAGTWKIFRVILAESLQYKLVGEIQFLELNPKNKEDIEKLYILTKEAISKCSLDQFYSQRQATGKYVLGNLICTDSVVAFIKKELRQIFPDIKVTPEEIRNVMLNEVVKREILQGEDYEEAKKKIAKFYKKKEKNDNKQVDDDSITINTETITQNGDNTKESTS
jgi:predicted type IV restriction endonuclease